MELFVCLLCLIKGLEGCCNYQTFFFLFYFFPSKGHGELPVIYKTAMTVNLGEMISSIINISYQVWVLKFYEVIEVLGMFFTRDRRASSRAARRGSCFMCCLRGWMLAAAP